MRKSPADRHNVCDDLPVPCYLSVFMLLFLLPALFLLLLLAPPKKIASTFFRAMRSSCICFLASRYSA